ncbi:ganglioside induced differentiation associated protein 1 [Phyllostomus discolor]|nr:ganglioside induced differentiation associated protein 1 [Phyllostomus discolor]
MPDKGSMYYPRVQHYRELLDSLPMDAYTHGCILHPELTVDSMIPAYATTRIRSQIGNTESELKKLAEENPDLQEAYIAKQKRLKVSKPGCPQLTTTICTKRSTFCKVSLF